jgi:hypothetical protein
MHCQVKDGLATTSLFHFLLHANNLGPIILTLGPRSASSGLFIRIVDVITYQTQLRKELMQD